MLYELCHTENNEIIPIAELKQTVIDFVDNNGSNYCGYCSGLQKKESSDHPKKAVISNLVIESNFL